MLRTFPVVLCSVTMLLTACKRADKPAGMTPDQVAKAGDPGKPADPAARPADPATSAATGNRELEAKGIAMTQRMADLFVADAKDCEKMATDIRAFTAQNKALLDQLAEMEKHQTKQERAEFATRNRSTLEALLRKVTPAMTACRDNKSVEAAMATLGPPE
jgi:hypothetical protein